VFAGYGAWGMVRVGQRPGRGRRTCCHANAPLSPWLAWAHGSQQVCGLFECRRRRSSLVLTLRRALSSSCKHLCQCVRPGGGYRPGRVGLHCEAALLLLGFLASGQGPLYPADCSVTCVFKASINVLSWLLCHIIRHQVQSKFEHTHVGGVWALVEEGI